MSLLTSLGTIRVVVVAIVFKVSGDVKKFAMRRIRRNSRGCKLNELLNKAAKADTPRNHTNMQLLIIVTRDVHMS